MVQDKIAREIKDVAKDAELTFDHLSKLVYVEKVIKETLRLHTTLPLVGRRVSKQVFENEGIMYPSGVSPYNSDDFCGIPVGNSPRSSILA